MSLKSTLFASVAISAMVTGALASDDFSTQTGNSYDWSGFYVGVLAGYGFGEYPAESGSGTIKDSVFIHGGMLGAAAGGNVQFDKFVLGVEGDIVWSGASASGLCTPANSTCNVDIDWMGSIRGRAGVALDHLLLFGTAGVAFGGATASVSPPTAGTTGSDTQTYVGWTAGLGAEYAVTENIRLKAEYSYTDLGSRTSAAGTLAVDSVITTPKVHAVKAGINFAF